MARRKTAIGIGPFGRPISPQAHAYEVLQRILSRGYPLTEDAVFLSMLNILLQKGSTVFQKVRTSRDLGGYRYMSFSPDIDLLEVRSGGTVIGYELKGERKQGREVQTPMFYEGIDQGLAYLVNPKATPLAESFIGSIFDYVYVVHPDTSEVSLMGDLVERYTPLGLVVVGRRGTKELIKPKTNHYLSNDVKKYFLSTSTPLAPT